ncbi:hypothetical protein OsccyDRAFT_0749 [Leptolyngbyaceae cyanobacterium JSC-12]|nr:hypothetical protein OsccyDRAFT_0749 [Leptolyngbyaceae cyanobacterium JSC-12]
MENQNQLDHLLDKFQEMSRWSVMRQFFVDICLSQRQGILFLRPEETSWARNDKGGLYHLPSNKFVLQKYFECFYLMQLVVSKVATETSEERQMAGNPEGLLICRLMEADADRVNLPTALCCWLTTDEFRWQQVDDVFGDYFPDLSYGLVLSHPKSVVAAAAFVCGFRYLQTDSRVPYDLNHVLLLEDCREFAKNFYASLTKKEINECISLATETTRKTIKQTFNVSK